MREAFDDDIVRRYARSFHLRRLGWYRQRPDLQRRIPTCSYAEGGAILRLKPPMLTILAEFRYLSRVRSDDSQHWLFWREELEALDARWCKRQDVDTLAQAWNLTPMTVRDILQAGFLVYDADILEGDYVNQRYPLVMRRLLQSCIQPGPPQEPVYSFPTLVQHFFRDDWVDFLRRVVERRPTIHARAKDRWFTMPQLYMTTSSVQRFLRE